ncbi:MAG: hypothetical protein KAT05_17445 [Spirochaetes bacterium]|nr:hypothetical protein [Spirochaetota bacterium]
MYRSMGSFLEYMGESIKALVYVIIFVLIGWFIIQLAEMIEDFNILPEYIIALVTILLMLLVALKLISHYNKNDKKPTKRY